MIHSVRAHDTNRSNWNHFFAVHRETESQVPSDADLEHPDGKNAETGRFQVRFTLYLTLHPRAMMIHLSHSTLGGGFLCVFFYIGIVYAHKKVICSAVKNLSCWLCVCVCVCV